MRISIVLIACLTLTACLNNQPGKLSDQAIARRCQLNTSAPTKLGNSGHGAFGFWQAGPLGLPEYRYELDQLNDDRALWPNTENKERREHWHMVANVRLTALAYNDGYVEIYTQERGLEALNRFDPATHNFAGGFSLIDYSPANNNAADAVATAYRFKPEQAITQREFGMGYVRNTWCDGQLKVIHTIWAPEGNHPFVIDDIELINVGPTNEFDHYAIWDVNRHYMPIQLIRSGVLGRHIPGDGDEQRARLNDRFVQQGQVANDKTSARISLRDLAAKTTTTAIEPTDDYPYPPDIWLANLNNIEVDDFYLNGAAFWQSQAEQPTLQQHLLASSGPLDSATQSGILAVRQRLKLKAGQTQKLRFAIGAVGQNQPLPTSLQAFAYNDNGASISLEQSLKQTNTYSVQLTAPSHTLKDLNLDAVSLNREMTWHSYYLRNLGGYQDYFEHFVVNQGSAYWYKHGLDGAVRDFMFSVAALSYIDPWLARETLLYAARMRHGQSGRLSYSVGSYGVLSDAEIHSNPSDLDLFFWWGLAEYIFATGDWSILDAQEPYWPKSDYAPVPIWQHIQAGALRLLDQIGVGPHGFIRLGSGDWDDSITFFAEDKATAEDEGESLANAAMAARFAPWAALMLRRYGASDVANRLDALAAAQAAGLDSELTEGGWYRRAYFGPDAPFGDQVIFLLSNALNLIAEIPNTAAQAQQVIDTTITWLSKPSTTSLFQFHYFDLPEQVLAGATDEGATNPVISMLAIWGISRYDRQTAWRELLRNTMTLRAEVYPAWWFGIWSGPDSYYTNVFAKQAGQSWASVATPMKDFPVMNSNWHNGMLLSAFRVFGLEPVTTANEQGQLVGALQIAPRLPASDQGFRLQTPLLTVATSGDKQPYHVEYRPITNTTVYLHLLPPPGSTQIKKVNVNTKPIWAGNAANYTLELAVVKNQMVTILIE